MARRSHASRPLPRTRSTSTDYWNRDCRDGPEWHLLKLFLDDLSQLGLSFSTILPMPSASLRAFLPFAPRTLRASRKDLRCGRTWKPACSFQSLEGSRLRLWLRRAMRNALPAKRRSAMKDTKCPRRPPLSRRPRGCIPFLFFLLQAVSRRVGKNFPAT